MSYKRNIDLIAFAAITITVIFELFFLNKFALQKTSTNSLRVGSTTPVSQALPPGTQSLFDLPDGYVVTSTNQIAQSLPQSYILLAKLLGVALQKDNSILANISFASSQGSGRTITQPILISPILNLARQRTPRMFPTSDDIKTTVLQDPKQTLQTLQNLQGKSILFTFLNQVPDPNAKTPQNGIDPQCNNAFLLTLSVNYAMPKCLPFTHKITIYEEF